jgi:hypothetical protein
MWVGGKKYLRCCCWQLMIDPIRVRRLLSPWQPMMRNYALHNVHGRPLEGTCLCENCVFKAQQL